MTWSQNYLPLGGLVVSALVAALPVVVLLVLLGGWHVRAHFAALAGLATAFLVAIFAYHMPAPLVLAAGGFGAAFGLFPIGWIVLNAIFIYQLAVETGEFEALKKQIANLSGDRRIQALLIAFSFGAFIEGCAGFGAPVAITGAMLLGLGFKPLEAAKLSLIGNTAPVAFGSLGIPLVTLSSVTGLDLHALSAMVGRQLPIFSLIVPFWLVAAQVGWRGMKEVWPACLVCGASFAVTQFLVSNLHGPWLVDLVAAVVSMLALVSLLRVWQPSPSTLDVRCSMFDVQPPAGAAAVDATVEPYPGKEHPIEATVDCAAEHRTSNIQHPTSNAQNSPFRAWIPWIMLSLFVGLWTTPFAKTALNGYPPTSKPASTWQAPLIPITPLAGHVLRMPPVVANPEPEKAVFTLNWLSATGTALLFAGIVSGLCLGVRPGALVRLYVHCAWRVRVSMLTIALMLALGYTTRFCGSDTTMGLAFAATGSLFPFFSPLLGWLGVALTGSDTASNVLFGNLQKTTAISLGISPILTAASNSSGGVMGKMIDAQSIVVASIATGGGPESPDAGTILRAVFWHSLALAVLVGVLVLLQARVFPQIIPS